MAGEFERLTTGNEVLEKIQDNVERALDRTQARRILSGLEFPAGATLEVKHGLGRAPIHWWPVRVLAGYFQAYETARTATLITFQSLNACTEDLEIE